MDCISHRGSGPVDVRGLREGGRKLATAGRSSLQILDVRAVYLQTDQRDDGRGIDSRTHRNCVLQRKLPNDAAERSRSID